MQEKSERRSNSARTAATRAALMQAARHLFSTQGYAETGTPEIVRTAQVTRGALYHHFADKADLFRAVYLAEAEAVAAEIDAATSTDQDPIEAMLDGGQAYFQAVSDPARARILLIDAPSVLSPEQMREIDRNTGGSELAAGLRHLLGDTDEDVDVLAELMSSMFERAALIEARTGNTAGIRRAMERLMRGLKPAP